MRVALHFAVHNLVDVRQVSDPPTRDAISPLARVHGTAVRQVCAYLGAAPVIR